MCTSGALTIAMPRFGGSGRVGIIAEHAAGEHVVGQVDALRWAGGPAGQHAHRTPGLPSPEAVAAAGLEVGASSRAEITTVVESEGATNVATTRSTRSPG